MPLPHNVLFMVGDARPGRGTLLRARCRRPPERLEARTLLSAMPIQFGAVYVERDLGSDASPDSIEVSFVGGAPGTELTRIQLQGDKFAPGLSLADMLFDTQPGGLGADLAFAGLVTSRHGEFSERIHVQDGSSLVTLELEGFEAGERLTLSIDVDEMQGYQPQTQDLESINDNLDPIASGAEFQGTQLIASFAAPHFYPATTSAEFHNRYDEALLATDLQLPLDDEDGNRDRTAGAVGELQQTPLPISIAGRVFEDRDADLVQEAGDLGIANVTLSLFVHRDGEFVFTGHSTSTDGSGDYSFDASLGLLPGTYEIREQQPDGYFSVGAAVGIVDGIASGEVRTADVLTRIEIPHGGMEGENYNFAEARPSSIRGEVHLSTPAGDCFGESVQHTPLANVQVQLLDANGQRVSETTTDSQGRYAFHDLRPGQYTVVEITPDHLLDGGARAGTIDGVSVGTASTSRIDAIQLQSGDRAIDYEFCDHLPATLAGSVYHDRDNDGHRTAGEEGIEGALLSLLDESDAIVDTVETDGDGRYEFVNIRAGNYRVIEMQPTPWLDGRDRAGTVDGTPRGRAENPGDEIVDITLLWGSIARDYDFGELQPTSLEGRVHLSTPEGDCWNIEEGLLEPVAGAVVQLLDAHGKVLAETTTDADGNYFFDDLAPGDYSVREHTPVGLRDAGAHPGRVAGTPRGLVRDGEIVDIRLDSGERGEDFDFCEHPPATLSGYVYADDDNDGQRESREQPIAGVTLELLDEQQQVVATAVTDQDGYYAFEGLALGRYAVRERQPVGYLDGLDTAGTVGGETRGLAMNPGDMISDVYLGWGEVGEAFNFGELRPASLSGHVRSSPQADCWDDEEALRLAGVHIRLLGEDGRLVAETITNAAGAYRFDDLPPGQYHVLEEQPTTQFDGGQRAGSVGGDVSVANRITDVPLAAGDAAVHYDFCELPPSSVSGFVFVDGPPITLRPDATLPQDISPLRDGVLTADDRPLPGVQLELRDGIRGAALDGRIALPGAYPVGEPIRTTTDKHGFYEFGSLPKGNYAVYEVHPEGFVDGIDTPGTTDGVAINPLPEDSEDIFLETVRARLTENPRNDAIVLIAVPPGVDSQRNNFSEVLVEETPPFVPSVPFPTPTLSPPVRLEQPELYQFLRELPPVPREEFRYPDDGSSSALHRTWHLSVIDGGQPRVAQPISDTPHLFPTSLWQQSHLATARWQIQRAGQTQTYTFGGSQSVPISGDFNGDGTSEMGVFNDGHWYIDINANGRWDAQDLWAKLGYAGDLPVVGDWDGDGKDDIGIFGRAWPGDPRAWRAESGLPDMENVPDGSQKNMPPAEGEATLGRRVMKLTARGQLRADVIDHVFLYGSVGDQAAVGDWNGDGIDTVGVFRRGVWLLDVDGNGRWTDPDVAAHFGSSGDIPLVGDFNGDGIDDLAVIRNGKIIVDSNRNRQLDSSDRVIHFDPEKGSPVVGKWNGHAADEFAWFRTFDDRELTVANRENTQ